MKSFMGSLTTLAQNETNIEFKKVNNALLEYYKSLSKYDISINDVNNMGAIEIDQVLGKFQKNVHKAIENYDVCDKK